jgi:CRP/FNR family transcriptional regulator, cyclic AMP receptor protein
MASVLDICRDLEKVSFSPGDLLLPQGEKTGCLYILISGKLEVVQGETSITFISEPGSIVGELSVLLDLPHQVDVKAVTPTVCHVTRGGREFLGSNPDLTMMVAELLAKRLKGMLGYLADIKSQYEDRKDQLGMVDEVLLNLAHRIPRK